MIQSILFQTPFRAMRGVGEVVVGRVRSKHQLEKTG